MIETIPVFRPGFLRDGSFAHGIGERSAVDYKNVQAAVIVIVEKGDAGSHGFQKIFFRGVRGLVLKVDSAGGSGVDELSRLVLRSALRSYGLLRRNVNWREEKSEDGYNRNFRQEIFLWLKGSATFHELIFPESQNRLFCRWRGPDECSRRACR